MLPLSPERLVLLWEQGRHRHPIDRALLALALSCPERSPDELAALPIGARDAELFQLRCLSFGPTLTAFTDCPRCSERMEFSLDGTMLGMWSPEKQHAIHVKVNDTVFRLPTSRDLALIVGEADPQRATRRLLAHCQVSPEAARHGSDARLWPDSFIAKIEQRMAEADSGATIELAISCDRCGHGWSVLFDIAHYVWEEIEAHAKRLLREVHALARAYAWSEHEILAMTDSRRALYLEMVGA